MLRCDPVGVVLCTDDPLAHRDTLHLHDLADRRWFQLPDGTDPIWRTYWSGGTPTGHHRDGPVVRTVHECLQAVLWNSANSSPLISSFRQIAAAVYRPTRTATSSTDSNAL